jgi:hypothetical protein
MGVSGSSTAHGAQVVAWQNPAHFFGATDDQVLCMYWRQSLSMLGFGDREPGAASEKPGIGKLGGGLIVRSDCWFLRTFWGMWNRSPRSSSAIQCERERRVTIDTTLWV